MTEQPTYTRTVTITWFRLSYGSVVSLTRGIFLILVACLSKSQRTGRSVHPAKSTLESSLTQITHKPFKNYLWEVVTEKSLQMRNRTLGPPLENHPETPPSSRR